MNHLPFNSSRFPVDFGVWRECWITLWYWSAMVMWVCAHVTSTTCGRDGFPLPFLQKAGHLLHVAAVLTVLMTYDLPSSRIVAAQWLELRTLD